jgi:Fungal Rad9-like Rad53-binding
VFAIKHAFQQAIACVQEDGHNAEVSQTNTRRPQQQVTQGFSHLASTVPDSQGLQQSIDVLNSLQPLAPPTNPIPLAKLHPRKMASQSSPHDTQVLSPSYYTNMINLHKSKSAADLLHHEPTEDVDDGVTQHTVHAGDPGYVDLGLDNSHEEYEEQEESDMELSSEPIDFSPTQATQNRIPQFPESQRFKTPATNGKKRNYLGDVIESPMLPRNPLAHNGITRTPLHALGLSQAFAGTQAASSPLMTRHVSVPTSDRPSPNFEIQERPATASLSSPLRPRSAFAKSATEPQSRYVSIKQSQAERERLAALKQQSSDDMLGDDQSDDEFYEEPSIVKRARRVREREENIRERFARFSSPSRRARAGPMDQQSSITATVEVSSPANPPHRQRTLPRIAGAQMPELEKDVPGDSEDETDVDEEVEVVVRNSSQIALENDEEDKENVQARALHVPETVTRLYRVTNGQLDHDMSPTLRRTVAPRPVEALSSSQTLKQDGTNRVGVIGSPTVAVENSQPDQPLAKKDVPKIVRSSKGVSGGMLPLSSVGEATQLSSSSCRDEGQTRHDHSQARNAGESIGLVQRHADLDEGSRHGPQIRQDELSQPTCQSPAIPDARPEDKRGAEPSSTVPETMSVRGSVSIPKESLDGDKSAKGIHADQQSSKYETAETHLSNYTTASRPLNSLFSSPSGRKRKRIGDIAAQPSPKKLRGEAEVEEVMAQMDDVEFYNAVDGLPGSSSPIAPGRKTKRPRLLDRQAVGIGDASDSADAQLSSRPATADIARHSRVLNTAQPLLKPRTRLRSLRRSEAIWDVQPSPPKSASARSIRNTAKESVGPSSIKPSNTKISRNLKKRGNTVTETLQNDLVQQAPPCPSVQEPSERAIAIEQDHPSLTELIAPNQVLACYNGNPRGYYPATCIGSTGVKSGGTFRYQIQWDDSSRDEIDEHGIRRLDLRIGDQVKMNLEDWPRVAHIVDGFKDRVDKVDGDFTDIRGYKTIVVKPKRRKSLPADVSTETVKEAPMSAIYLDTNMWKQMKDRVFDLEVRNEKAHLTLNVPQQLPSISGLTTPSERSSTPSTPNSRARRRSDIHAQPASTAFPFPTASGIFTSMAFAVSYNDDLRRTSLTKAILANGGTLLGEDFQEMFEQEWSPTSPSRRAHQTESLTLSARFHHNGFVALIADRHSRKPKYLQALALNLPALSGRWIEACIKAAQIVDWEPYLLSAGESMELEGAVRSRVLPPLDAKTALVRDIVSNRPNLLQGEAVVVVTGRGKSDEKTKPYIFLAKAAGAGRLEQCVDLKSAKALLDTDSEENIRWIFVGDKELAKAEAALLPKSRVRKSKGLRVVENEFLCQSLILGRLWERF